MTILKQHGKDRRIKLTEQQREKIKEERELMNTSFNKLAFKYGVSKRLVMFICDPEKNKVAREQFKERRMDGRYKMSKYQTRERWAQTIRDIRLRHKEIKEKITTD